MESQHSPTFLSTPQRTVRLQKEWLRTQLALLPFLRPEENGLPSQGLRVWVEYFMDAGQAKENFRRHLGTLEPYNCVGPTGTLSLCGLLGLFSATPILGSRSTLA